MSDSMTITALAPRPKRRLWFAVSAAIGGALVIDTVLWSALVPDRGFGDAAPAAWMLAQLDAAAKKGDWDRVDSFIDYDTKCRSIVPDLWDAADATSRAEFVALLKPMFRDSWLKAHESRAMQAGTWYEETQIGPGRSIIEEVGYDPDGEVALRYTFEAQGAEHRVVDRRPRVDTIVHDSSLAIKSIRGRIKGQLGRDPNLHEFTANLPTWMARGRTRVFRITPEMFQKD